jgi:hypothetical protein
MKTQLVDILAQLKTTMHVTLYDNVGALPLPADPLTGLTVKAAATIVNEPLTISGVVSVDEPIRIQGNVSVQTTGTDTVAIRALAPLGVEGRVAVYTNGYTTVQVQPFEGRMAVEAYGGYFNVDCRNFPSTYPVTGSVAVTSLPAITGTVNIGTMPPIEGNVVITAATQPLRVVPQLQTAIGLLNQYGHAAGSLIYTDSEGIQREPRIESTSVPVYMSSGVDSDILSTGVLNMSLPNVKQAVGAAAKLWTTTT